VARTWLDSRGVEVDSSPESLRSGRRRRSPDSGPRTGMEEAVEEPVEGAGPHLCLAPCRKCQAALSACGACHLQQDHDGKHECNAVSGEIHNW